MYISGHQLGLNIYCMTLLLLQGMLLRYFLPDNILRYCA